MPLTGEYRPSKSAWARKQAELYEATDGEKASDLRGRPIIVLTSVGSKTGKLRKTALMRVEHEGVYAVELQDGAAKRDYLALEVTGDEKAVWWTRAVATWPDYARYQTKTDRQIPVFVLEPFG